MHKRTNQFFSVLFILCISCALFSVGVNILSAQPKNDNQTSLVIESERTAKPVFETSSGDGDTPATYTITFDKNTSGATSTQYTLGTSAVSATQGLPMPTPIIKPTLKSASNADIAFQGYYDARVGGTKYYDENGYCAQVLDNNETLIEQVWDKSASATLYAHWAGTYALSFNNNAGDVSTLLAVDALSSIYVIRGINPITVDVSAFNAVITHTFLGFWDASTATGGTQYFDEEGTSIRVWDKSVNTTLYARWRLNNITTPSIATNLVYNGFDDRELFVNTDLNNNTADGYEYTPYDSTPDTAYTATGAIIENSVIKYKDGATGSWETTAPRKKDAGSYTVYIAAFVNGVIQEGENAIVSKTITIAKKGLTVIITNDDKPATEHKNYKTYGDAGFTFTFEVDGTVRDESGTTVYNVGTGTPAYKDADGNAFINTTATPAGVYAITPAIGTLVATSNYEFTTFNSATFTVNRKAATPSTISTTEASPTPAGTYGSASLTVSPIDGATITGNGSSGATNTTDAGTYTVIYTLNNNYYWSDLTAQSDPTEELTAARTHYFNVAKKGLTLTISDSSMTYWAPATLQPVTVSATGLTNSETVYSLGITNSSSQVVISATNTDAAVSRPDTSWNWKIGNTTNPTTAELAALNAGNYDLTIVQQTLTNYEVSITKGTFTVNPKMLTKADLRNYGGFLEGADYENVPYFINTATNDARVFNTLISSLATGYITEGENYGRYDFGDSTNYIGSWQIAYNNGTAATNLKPRDASGTFSLPNTSDISTANIVKDRTQGFYLKFTPKSGNTNYTAGVNTASDDDGDGFFAIDVIMKKANLPTNSAEYANFPGYSFWLGNTNPKIKAINFGTTYEELLTMLNADAGVSTTSPWGYGSLQSTTSGIITSPNDLYNGAFPQNVQLQYTPKAASQGADNFYTRAHYFPNSSVILNTPISPLDAEEDEETSGVYLYNVGGNEYRIPALNASYSINLGQTLGVINSSIAGTKNSPNGSLKGTFAFSAEDSLIAPTASGTYSVIFKASEFGNDTANKKYFRDAEIPIQVNVIGGSTQDQTTLPTATAVAGQTVADVELRLGGGAATGWAIVYGQTAVGYTEETLVEMVDNGIIYLTYNGQTKQDNSYYQITITIRDAGDPDPDVPIVDPNPPQDPLPNGGISTPTKIWIALGVMLLLLFALLAIRKSRKRKAAVQ
ncbi:MAG: hypothetical protein LBM01_00575 [Christensenellaceae bacterium]|jgi:hypothetical protein|nr:hypothetical protein [Christensenellaceae bacterium]